MEALHGTWYLRWDRATANVIRFWFTETPNVAVSCSKKEKENIQCSAPKATLLQKKKKSKKKVKHFETSLSGSVAAVIWH